MILARDAVIEIARAEPVRDYKLKLFFSDGAERLVDFEPFLRGSRNPLIREYLNPDRFKSFEVEQGDLIWDDYGLSFPIADLYENRI